MVSVEEMYYVFTSVWLVKWFTGEIAYAWVVHSHFLFKTIVEFQKFSYIYLYSTVLFFYEILKFSSIRKTPTMNQSEKKI